MLKCFDARNIQAATNNQIGFTNFLTAIISKSNNMENAILKPHKHKLGN